MSKHFHPYELDVEALPLERFSFNPERKTLTAEASDLGKAFRIQRLYNDALDEGIVIQSHKTGKVERFIHSDTDRDREGDVAGWWFVPANAQLSRKIERVLVIND